MLAIENKWLGDFWLYPDGDLWHIYYLQADKSLNDPDFRHWHASQGHATSKDLHHWDVKGTCLQPARPPAWDDCTTYPVNQDSIPDWTPETDRLAHTRLAL